MWGFFCGLALAFFADALSDLIYAKAEEIRARAEALKRMKEEKPEV